MLFPLRGLVIHLLSDSCHYAIAGDDHFSMPAKNFHVRQAAVSALRAWAKGRDYAESLIERHAHRRMLSSADRGLLQAILFGVLRNRRLLDEWIGKLREGKLDPETRDVLRVGLCQLLILGFAGARGGQ